MIATAAGTRISAEMLASLMSAKSKLPTSRPIAKIPREELLRQHESRRRT